MPSNDSAAEGHAKVGAWVRTFTGREGLIVEWHPNTGFFVIEFEDGSRLSEQAEYITVLHE